MSQHTNERATAAEQLLETVEKKSISRRSMLRAAWALPVIAAVPLLNTASAMSGGGRGNGGGPSNGGGRGNGGGPSNGGGRGNGGGPGNGGGWGQGSGGGKDHK